MEVWTVKSKNRAMILPVFVLGLVALSSTNALGAVDPDRIVFNQDGDPITGDVVLDLKDNNMTTIAYNVYDATGDPIGTLTSWNYTGQDVVNITEMNAGQTFRVFALKAGTAVLTVKSQGDTKNITKSVTITVKASSTKSSSTSSKKGFIPGFEVLPVLAAAGLLSLALSRKQRR
jgi:hypothetical protein